MANLSRLSISSWPEPVQRVQLLAESGLAYVPSQYVRPEAERPEIAAASPAASPLYHHDLQGPAAEEARHESLNIPVLDMCDLESKEKREVFLQELKRACEDWGFFHVKNHGVEERVVEGVRSAAHGFFKLPMSQKQAYSNDPITYQGYGSRLGVSKGATLDWGDYFFLNLLPPSSVDFSKWPTNPPHWREMVEEYGKQAVRLCKKIQGALAMSLGLEGRLEEAFGEMDMGLRINYYPPCPQPELTLGLSPHSDPGGITLLLQDDQVSGLQVKHTASSSWVTVPPLPGFLVVNLGDQLQILTNGKYRSVEHRVVVNNSCERLSLACFVNPGNDTMVAPLPELVPKDELPAYNAMTFKQYRAFIRNGGTNGKATLDAIASPTSLTASPILKHS